MTSDATTALLFVIAALLVWVALEIQRLHARIEPLASSRVATALAAS